MNKETIEYYYERMTPYYERYGKIGISLIQRKLKLTYEGAKKALKQIEKYRKERNK